MVEQSARTLASPTGWRDPRSLRNHHDIEQHLALLTRRENELSVALDEVLNDRTKLDASISRLAALSPKVRDLARQVDGESLSSSAGDESNRQLLPVFDEFSDDGSDAEELGLVERVRKVWVTSERVGGKVRKLDVEVSRVKEASERVQEVLELKSALQSLREAIPKGDWELATRCCKRAMDVKRDILESAFSARVIPTSSDPLPPPQALQTLRAQLLDTFKVHFREASARKEEQATSRFFKLFPMIGAEDDGLEVYGDFVTNLVKGRNPAGGKPSSPSYYIAHLTSLLESIALIVDQHQTVVEKYYGEGRMEVVVKRLQLEADGFVKQLVEGWEDERRVGRLIAETRQSGFAYLNNPVQSHATAFNANAANSVQASLAALSQAQHGLANLPGAASSLLAQYAGTGPKRNAVSDPVSEGLEEEKVGPDPRDVERIVGEMITLSGRWALYRRFIWSRLVYSDTEVDDAIPEEHAGNIARPTQAQPSVVTELAALDASQSQRAITNMLQTYYEPLEAWYLRTSIEKAHKMDTPDLSERPHVSSVVDDVFYLIKLVFNRGLTSGSIITLRSMMETVGRMVERDYLGVLQKKMDAVYSGGGAAIGLIGANLPGVSKEAEREKREKDLRVSYGVFLNDLDLSANYTERLVDEIEGSGLAEQWFLGSELPIVRSELKAFRAISANMRSAAKTGIDQLFNQLTKPRIRSLLEDVYKGITYLLDEDSYADAENDDLVGKRFVNGWEPLIDGYKASLTDTNFQTFFSMMVEVLVRPWEKMVLGMRFTELGAIRFDRDVRSIANYLSTQTEFGGGRDKFTRLQQIATVLNLDADEDPEEFYSSSGIGWRLSKSEYDGIVDIKVQ